MCVIWSIFQLALWFIHGKAASWPRFPSFPVCLFHQQQQTFSTSRLDPSNMYHVSDCPHKRQPLPFPYTSQQTFMACYHTYTVQKVPSWRRSHVNLVWQMFQTRTSFANVLFFQEFKSDSACWTIGDIKEKFYDSECMDFLLCGVNEYFV